MDQDKQHDVYFMNLVLQNQQLAMISLGKLKNPATDKIERNLEYAKLAIDTLDMLKAKTKGNLNEYEIKLLDEVVKELKLNYVDEVEKDKKPSDQKEEKPDKDTNEKKED